MPDPGMPYYDNTGGQQYGQDVPNPSQQMMDYSYLQNNQQIMNQGQSNISNTMRVAQDNFHRDMANVLQGTMAAGMAVYNVGKSAVDKFKETQYQDQLLGGGNYVLERGFMREASWASGMAQSDFGRAMKIGGRRPEFMTQDELQFQMQKSWNHRMQDLGMEATSGGAAVGASLIGMGLTKSMGLIKGSLVGMAIDQTVGRAIDVGIVRPHEYRNDFRRFAEAQDLSFGAGQRRMSDDVAGKFADSSYAADDPWRMARLVPLVGDFIADRGKPDTDIKEFKKKMMAGGLFRDSNINDIAEMEKFVRDTIKVVEKVAALNNTTKDAVLAFKANLRAKGLNTNEQDAAALNVTQTTMSTGLDFNTVTSYNTLFQTMGYQANMRKGIVAQSGLAELRQIKALQQAGLIDEEMDAGSLAIKNTQRAIQNTQTGSGKVATYGGPNLSVGRTRDWYGGRGSSAEVGFAMEQMGFDKPSIDPNQNFQQNARRFFDFFISKGHPHDKALIETAVALKHDGSPESVAQIEKALFQNSFGNAMVSGAQAETLRTRTGVDHQTTFRVNDVQSRGSVFGDSRYGRINIAVGDIYTAQAFKPSSDSEKKFLSVKSKFRKEFEGLYGTMGTHDPDKADALRSELAEKLKSEGVEPDEIERVINLGLKEFEDYNRKHDSPSMANGYGTSGILSLKKRLDNEKTFLMYDTRKVSKYQTKHLAIKENQQNKFNELGDKYTGVLQNLYNNITVKTNPDGTGATSSVGIRYTDFLKQLEEAGATPDEIAILAKSFQSETDPDPERVKLAQKSNNGILTSYVSSYIDRQKSKKTNNETGFQNVFSALQKKDPKKYASIGKYESDVVTFRDRLTKLSGMKGSDAKAWLAEQGTWFQGLAQTVMGSDEAGTELVDFLKTKSSSDGIYAEAVTKNKLFKDFHISTANEDLRKTLESDSNPNTQAVRELATACQALTRAIAGEPPKKN